MFGAFGVTAFGVLRGIPAAVFVWRFAEKYAGAGGKPCASLGCRWKPDVAVAAMGSYLAALCGAAVGLSGILCDVLEFSEDCSGSHFRAATVWASGGMGICPLGVCRQENFDAALYCADAVPISGPDAVRIFSLESNGAAGYPLGSGFAKRIFYISCIHYVPFLCKAS